MPTTKHNPFDVHRRAGCHVRACGKGLGAIGLAETITEFLYALVLRKSFTPFESLFFLTGGSFELVGELVAVTLGIRYVWQANYGRDDLVDNMGVVLKDSNHSTAQKIKIAVGGTPITEERATPGGPLLWCEAPGRGGFGDRQQDTPGSVPHPRTLGLASLSGGFAR